MADEAEDLAPDLERVDDAVSDQQDDAAPQEKDSGPGFDVETAARSAGWAPKEDWRGEDDKEWVDAPTFVAQRLEKAQTLGKEVKRLRRTVETTTRVAERTIEQQRAAALEQARREVRQAVAENDTEAAEKALDRVKDISAERVDPAMTQFVDRNADWFNVDEEATAYAVSIAQVHANRGATAQKQTEEVEKAVRKRFPELFSDDEPKPRAPVKAPTLGAGTRVATPRKGKLTLADLPREAQEAARRFKAKGVSEQQFLENWEEENGR